jgi:hypothetical protein
VYERLAFRVDLGMDHVRPPGAHGRLCHDRTLSANQSLTNQLLCVRIRRLAPSETLLAGSSFRAHPSSGDSTVPWLYASDGAGLVDKLERSLQGVRVAL